MTIIALSLAAVMPSYAETITYIYDELNRLKRIEYGDGTVIEYRYDNAGNRLAILDTIPPAGTIAINSGVTSTNSISVTLTLSCSDNFGCSQMQFSNDGTNYSAAEAVSYAEIVPVLTEAIKEQQKAIQDLKAELEKMKVQ